jgi:hypothetical protein
MVADSFEGFSFNLLEFCHETIKDHGFLLFEQKFLKNMVVDEQYSVSSSLHKIHSLLFR